MIILFPQFVKLKIGRTSQVNHRNGQRFFKALDDFVENSDDTDSLYSTLNKEGVTDHKGAIEDLLGLLLAGTDTTAWSLTQILMRLKRHPEVYRKLKEEIHENMPDIGSNPEDFAQMLKMEHVDECEYLLLFIKECLRSQSPLYDSVPYRVLEDIRFDDGVFLPKGVEISMAIQLMQKNPDQWIRPDEFIPERFDPTNELYKTPSGKNRHSMAYGPFSSGIRACPGRSLAMLELKVFTVFFMKFMEWDISQDQLDNEELQFTFFTEHKLLAKVKSD